MLTPKVATGALGGALSIIVIWIIGQFGIVVPPEVSSAFTIVISTAASYFAPRSDPSPEQVSQILNTNAMQRTRI